jgi:hypothetical protein
MQVGWCFGGVLVAFWWRFGGVFRMHIARSGDPIVGSEAGGIFLKVKKI